MKPVPENPFYLTPWMPEEFFCYREGDIRGLMSNVRIGANTVLYAPPSAGKTALLYRFLRRPEIRNNYRTLYVALRGTKSQYDFFCALRDALRCKGVFSTYPSTYFDSVVERVEVLDAKLFRTAAGGDREELRRAAEAAIEEMLFLLDKNGPGVVVFDDFHEIEHYDRSMAALLRTHIQFLFNTRFIYSSGDLPALWKIFDNPEEPFYHSASTYAPKDIPVNDYLAFCQRCMAHGGKAIGRDSVELVCSLFRGNMKHTQEVMHFAYEMPEQEVTPAVIDRVIEDILSQRGDTYRRFLGGLESDNLRNIVIMLGREGEVRQEEMEDKAHQHGVSDDADVVEIWKELSFRAEPIALRRDGAYCLADGMLRLWISRCFSATN